MHDWRMRNRRSGLPVRPCFSMLQCSIARPDSKANDWLCLLTWIVGGVTVVLMVVLALLMARVLLSFLAHPLAMVHLH